MVDFSGFINLDLLEGNCLILFVPSSNLGWPRPDRTPNAAGVGWCQSVALVHCATATSAGRFGGVAHNRPWDFMKKWSTNKIGDIMGIYDGITLW